MDIEEELAELKAELDRTNENSKVKNFVNSRQYRALKKKQLSKICEICGKEYRISHLCETVWKFESGDFWKHYSEYETLQKRKTAPTNPLPSSQKPIELVKKQSYKPQPKTQKKSSNNCGACMCVIIIIILFVIIF